MSVTSPLIIIPLDATAPFNLAFDHFVSLQNESDGGNIKYKIGNGSWTLIPKSAFIDNAYNGALLNCFNDCDNPLLNQDVFTGGNGGSLTSNWGQSRIDLTSLGLNAGQTIQFRWDLGSDGCGGWDGWYIDDIRVYSCSLPTVQFTTTTSIVDEGEANLPGAIPNLCLPYIEKKITIKISKAPSQPVLVTLNPPTGTAQQGNSADYSLIPNSFMLQAGTLSKDILLRVNNDANVEGDETVLLSYSLSLPNGGNASPEQFNQQHTVKIIDDELLPEVTSINLIVADFNDGLPNEWKTVGGGDFPETWDVVDYKSLQKLDPSGTPYLYTNSGWGFQAPGQLERIIETASFNSLDAKSLNVSFLEFFLPISGIKDFPEQGIVDVWDGSIWHNLLTQNKETGESGDWDSPANREIAIPLAFRNAAMKIRFRYIADWNGLWAIDNFKVTATYNNTIQTTISQTPDSQYLGPNSTVYFRDPTSGNLIAKIKNLTAHDYGCTSVQVDRAGVDEINWVGAKKITKKTFKVTPTNINPNGNYEITLYYKASELANFNGADIKSMGKSEGGILLATAVNSQTAPVQMAMFNSDYAYTATFNSGFSGFGLSDVAAGSALPVTLSKFEGKHTFEGNVLVWETSTELNNDYFIIERAIDAETFGEIARIEGVGNSAILNSYSFTDNSFTNHVNYYLLKQVDADGTFAFSRMIAIESRGQKEIKYFPNPVQSHLNIEISERDTKSARISVVNSAGQIVLNKEKVKIHKGKISVDLSRLAAGVYQIVVSTENGNYHSSIVKAP